MKKHILSQVRIISGHLRGSKLPVLANIDGLRPTPDRVKETLFNWLMPVIEGSRCLDLFAGTGALGIEAISRGAAAVTLVEAQTILAKNLIAQIERLKITNATVVQQSALVFLQQTPPIPYDIVFLDPPFDENLWEPCIQLLQDHSWLSEQAWIYTELPSNRQLLLAAPWVSWRSLHAGEVCATLWRLMD